MIHKLTVCAMFIALGVTLGYSLSSVPNIELVTATIFIAGYVTGWKCGAGIGFVTESIYAAVNPFGVASPPLFISMVLAMSITGISGGIYRRIGSSHTAVRHLQTGLAGAALSLNFAVMTTLGYLLFMGLPANRFLMSCITGIGFYLTHIAGNFIIFLIIVPILIETFETNGLLGFVSLQTGKK
ncbi:ECF transporter S component [bacterium]|nr:ECF transporter S component [bacterium]